MEISTLTKEYRDTERGISNGRILGLWLTEGGSKILGSWKLCLKSNYLSFFSVQWVSHYLGRDVSAF